MTDLSHGISQDLLRELLANPDSAFTKKYRENLARAEENELLALENIEYVAAQLAHKELQHLIELYDDKALQDEPYPHKLSLDVKIPQIQQNKPLLLLLNELTLELSQLRMVEMHLLRNEQAQADLCQTWKLEREAFADTIIQDLNLNAEEADVREAQERLANRPLPTQVLNQVPLVLETLENRVQELIKTSKDELTARKQARQEMHILDRALNNDLITLIKPVAARAKQLLGQEMVDYLQREKRLGLFTIANDFITPRLTPAARLQRIQELDDAFISNQVEQRQLNRQHDHHCQVINGIFDKISCVLGNNTERLALLNQARERLMKIPEEAPVAASRFTAG